METREYRVVTASEIVKFIMGEPSGKKNNRIFGKVFEECYSTANYIVDKHEAKRQLPWTFRRAVAVQLKAAGIIDYKTRSDMVRRAWMMYSCLLANSVKGLKPRTRFRELNDDIMVAGQPDVVTDDDEIIEYKTYPINNYARCQAKVFSWVWERPVLLVGLVSEDNRYHAEKEPIDGNDFEFPLIPDDIGTIQKFIDDDDYDYDE